MGEKKTDQPAAVVVDLHFPRQVVTQVPMRQLLHDVKSVIERVNRGERVQITRNGKVVLVATAPDPDEQALDELVAAGDISADWRDQQAGLRRLLSGLPGVTAPAGPPLATEALLADRYEDNPR